MASPPHESNMVVVTHVYRQQDNQRDVSPQIEITQPSSNVLRKFLKGEPAVLGPVQIMTGMVIFLLGIISAFVGTLSAYFGITFWGAIIYITAGSLTVRAHKELNRCLINASMGMNIVSSITAGLAIILHSFDFIVPVYPHFSCGYEVDCKRHGAMFWSSVWGTIGVLLVLSLLEFVVSIYVSAFACQAICSSDIGQVIYISNQAPPPNPTSHLPVPSVDTCEMPVDPTILMPPVHTISACSWGNGKDPPPAYTATQD